MRWLVIYEHDIGLYSGTKQALGITCATSYNLRWSWRLDILKATHICIADSEKAPSTSYLCLNITIRQTYTVSEISSLLLAGNDVMAFSPVGNAAYDLYMLILKGRPRFYIHVSLTFIDIHWHSLTFWVYLLLFIRVFYLRVHLAGISNVDLLKVVSGDITPYSTYSAQNQFKHTTGASMFQTTSLETSYVNIRCE